MKLNMFGNNYNVRLERSRYRDNDSLAVVVIDEDTEDVFDVITVNLEDSFLNEENQAYINTNDCDYILPLLMDYDIAEDTGFRSVSGFCTYPLYEFDLSKLSPEKKS